MTTFEAGVLTETVGAALLALLLGMGDRGMDDAAVGTPAIAAAPTVVAALTVVTAHAPAESAASTAIDAGGGWFKRDSWLGEDKARHFGLSYALVTGGAAGARAVGMDRDAALLAGVAGAVAAGLAKEIYDGLRGDGFSVRDLVADAAGIAAAVLVVRASR